jgi:hypothetical protein
VADIACFEVRFDGDAFAEDLAHATPAGRDVALRARARLEREGLAAEECRRCLAEGPEGTALTGCAKLYLPHPVGRWGLVLRLARAGEQLVLYHLAFGVRHPERAWQPSVYQVAHHRLHGPESDVP